VSTHLTWGDPTLSFCFLRALCFVRTLVFQGLLFSSLVPQVPGQGGMPLIHAQGGIPLVVRQGVPPGLPFPVDQGREQQGEQMRLIQQKIRRELDIRQEAQRLLLQTQLRQLIEKLVKDKPDLLCEKLRRGTPLERFVALQVIGRRRLPLEKELIEALRDPDKAIRQTAHDALVRVSRGTDFGPSAGVSKRGLDRAVKQWRQWLDLQQMISPRHLAESIAVAAAAPRQKDPFDAVQFVAIRGGFELQTASKETASRSDELVNATADEQKSILTRLRDAEGNDNTEALAQAIPKLSDDLQAEAREALTRRFTRLTAAALRDGLLDDNLEVRCAAALACGRKIAKEHIPDLLQLLDDPELDVVLSARVALTELTGEDFGPTRDVDHVGCVAAAEAWRKWWKDCQAKR
jgi:HEAT repeat protein